MSLADRQMLEALRPVLAAFEQLDIEHCIGGSIASGIFGEPRGTRDADLVARMFGHQAAPFVELLGTRYYADLSSILAAT